MAGSKTKEEIVYQYNSHGISNRDFKSGITLERNDLYAAMDIWGKQESIAFGKYIGGIMNGETKVVFPNGTTSFEELYSLYIEQSQSKK